MRFIKTTIICIFCLMVFSTFVYAEVNPFGNKAHNSLNGFVLNGAEYCGVYDITYYCESCSSKTTSTGRFEIGYSVASSDFEPGTILIIDGREYRVDDCGCPHGVIDFLIDGSDGCNCNYYGRHQSEVYVKR